MNLKTFIKDHPVASYCLPVMLWSFAWWTLILFQVPIGRLFDPPLRPSVVGFLLAGLLAPSVFGLVLTRIIDGKGSLVALLYQHASAKLYTLVQDFSCYTPHM